MKFHLTTKRWAMAAVTMLVLPLAACGSSSGDADAPGTDTSSSSSSSNSSGSEASSDLHKITAEVLFISQTAPLYLAINKGYFKDHGLDVSVEVAASGPVIVPALESGSAQIGLVAVPPTAVAISKGIDLKALLVSFYDSKDSPVYGVVATKGTTAEDLKGQRVAINGLYNVDYAMFRDWLTQQDMDPDSVELVPTPFPDMLANLDKGTVSAAVLTEPFLTQAKQKGFVDLGSHFTAYHDHMPASTYVASSKWLESNPDLAKSFIAALQEATEDLNADQSLYRQIIEDTFKIPAEVASEMGLGDLETANQMNCVKQELQIAIDQGLLKESDGVTADSLVWEQAPKSTSLCS